MDDTSALILMCCAVPADKTRRLVLADNLAECGEVECEEALRSADGEKVIREVYRLADKLKREPCLRLLWTVAAVQRKLPPAVLTFAPGILSDGVLVTGQLSSGTIEAPSTLTTGSGDGIWYSSNSTGAK